MNLKQNEHTALRDIKEFIEEHYERNITIRGLSRLAGFNIIKFQNGFKELYKKPVYSYLTEVRMKKAAELLLHSDLSIKEIASAAGYNSTGKFDCMFKKHFGQRPTHYRTRVNDNYVSLTFRFFSPTR
jgi:two-component system response regulator YesN